MVPWLLETPRGQFFLVTLSQYPLRVQSVKQWIKLHDIVVISSPIQSFPLPFTFARVDDDRKYILGIIIGALFLNTDSAQ